jgi:hypothetical protein
MSKPNPFGFDLNEALPRAIDELRQVASAEQLNAALIEIQERVSAAIAPYNRGEVGAHDAGERLGELDEELMRSERLVGRAWVVMTRGQLATIRAARAAQRG